MIKFSIPGETGCSQIIGGRHMLTFRMCAAGYYDVDRGGDSNFGGFRSSCSSNLIPAGGLLNAPDYTRTCMCMYQNQCSLALMHMPDTEIWYESTGPVDPGPVQRVGINFGAPGDRLADNDTLWLDYPSVGGRSPDIDVSVTPETVTYFRRHSSVLTGPGLRWVASSGARGVRRITLALGPADAEPRTYTVRLYFAETEDIDPGARVFAVALQDRTVINELDLAKTTGIRRPLVREFTGIKARDSLALSLEPAKDTKLPPVISGIEIAAQRPKDTSEAQR